MITRSSSDQSGRDWTMAWGVLDPDAALRDMFGVEGPLSSGSERVTFNDPLYPSETKTLSVYKTLSGANVCLGEISNAVWAVGIPTTTNLRSAP